VTPLIVITRDRVTYTRQCLASLEPYGLDIHIVDHGSTWLPMLDWLAECPYPVHRRGDLPPRALWEWNELDRIVGPNRYLVTDPDVVLDDACPRDWLARLDEELSAEAVHGATKVGLGLRIDDLPDTELTAMVRRWESAFWAARTSSGRAWRAPVDTTLALYRHGAAPFALGPAARLDAPYLARHLPWYGEDPAVDETNWYRAYALPGASHWINGGW
jgi:hypothetical protein